MWKCKQFLKEIVRKSLLIPVFSLGNSWCFHKYRVLYGVDLKKFEAINQYYERSCKSHFESSHLHIVVWNRLWQKISMCPIVWDSVNLSRYHLGESKWPEMDPGC